MRVRTLYLLLLLCAVPFIAGLFRIFQLASGAPLEDGNERFLNVPIHVSLHIVSASMFSILGALQFDERLRAAKPSLHRILGRIAALSGLAAATTGVWLSHFSDIPTALQGSLLYWTRIIVGATMSLSIVKAVLAVYAGRLAAHRAWMIRAYALGQGAGTQVLLMLPLTIFLGHDITGPSRDILMLAAWCINWLAAELVISHVQSIVSPVRRPA